MTLEAVLDHKKGRHRRMTKEKLLVIALRPHELACEITRQQIRTLHPQSAEHQTERLLREQLPPAKTT